MQLEGFHSALGAALGAVFLSGLETAKRDAPILAKNATKYFLNDKVNEKVKVQELH